MSFFSSDSPSGNAASQPAFSPLYQQIRQAMLQSLQAGEWKPLQAIPSEIELAKRYNVSQGTVRKAIDELVAENLLVRRQGMVWTKEQIEQRIHGLGSEVESNTVEVYIYNLRKKLSSDFIQNMRGVGYFLKAEA